MRGLVVSSVLLVIILLLILTTTAELDCLCKIGTWCVRFAVVVLFLALVGGNWNWATSCGLWYWTLADDVSIVTDNRGARPLILKLGFGVCASVVFVF